MPSRAAFLTGPARVYFQSLSFFTEADLSIDISIESAEKKSAAHGVYDRIDRDVSARFSFKPDGRLSTNRIAALWPYLNPTIGAALLSDSASDTASTVPSVPAGGRA